MQTTGTALLVVNRCSPARVWMLAHDSRSVRGLLYLAAVRNDSHHLIRSDLQPRPVPARFGADLLKYSSTVRSRRRR